MRRLLDDGLLARIHERAAAHDRDNTFPDDDFAELRTAGYLAALAPERLGGAGLSLEELTAEQTRLAQAAPATALAVNMHLVWTAVAKTLLDRGDDALEFVLREAAAGEVFAFGVSEAGNDLVLFGSTVAAAPRADGGYAYTGTKTFTSLSPVWTRLGTFGLDSTSEDAPRIVWGFLDRSADGIEIREDWDTLGQRATQSNTTVLTGAVVPADRIVRRLPPGPNPDPLVFGVFVNFEILLASVYAGIAHRAVALAAEAAARRTSLKLGGASRSDDPDVRRRIASAALIDDGLDPQIRSLARDVDERADHGPWWFAKASGLKVRVTDQAKGVVDQAILVGGGSGYAASSELSRLYRDVLAGAFNPSSADSALTTIATAVLGPVSSPDS
ncbi:acyl-CoA dehydrogenase family protein [Amnibacterium sp.]|uniref:acyl-CoA dehydrogenase family protein n=1 Tax=Amnibacterium sp. TaxID=1872496 RepID=UPI002604DE12|nr:acyl-CoA dehydrogenase family protein [Amnibacterium sp.]MCU1472057.1 acyl-CoA dehydrogenase [Amnibacterium sp.]